ncbi:TIR domain-containing protein [Motiliproteus sp.]|uniref:TIR domain-containing protein n=1 Tax=Motiliproteus sp. TaxID=1898955 RepID=UPI003BA93C57
MESKALLVEEAIGDLQFYVEKKGFILSSQAEEVFRQAEETGKKYNLDIYYYIVLMTIIRLYPELRSLMLRNGCDPSDAIQACINLISISRNDDEYSDNRPPYSETVGTRGSCRASFIDSAIAAAIQHDRKEILKLDILEGVLADHDQLCPVVENINWTDSALHVPYNTLSHILGHYEQSLWIKFEVIRKELNIYKEQEFRNIAIDNAPQRLRSSLFDFFSDWPDYRTNCFLIMPFRETKFHKEVHLILKDTLTKYGFNLLRADDRAYSDDVLSNIETYIFGSKFSFAIHERVENDSHNANVALEVGYFMGQGKEVCLLKENSVSALPSDLQGRLYVTFSMFDVANTLPNAVEGWLKGKRLI